MSVARNTLDCDYDNALRSVVTDQATYEAGGRELHLLGSGLDNEAAAAVTEFEDARRQRELAVWLENFVRGVLQ